jgi:tetratricopeptide (TPR) repeat protein
MEYMVGAGYSPQGMVGLMDVLRSMSRRQPSAIEAMFSSHPMSTERYDTAVARSRTRFGGSQSLPVYRERYMDSTARLRRLAPMFKLFQEGDKAMAAKEYAAAQGRYAEGLKLSPNDYAGLVMMSKCMIAQKNAKAAADYAARARRVYPTEAQAHHMHGVASIHEQGLCHGSGGFSSYERILPGNPTTVFMKGFSYEGMKNKQNAAQEYQRLPEGRDPGRNGQARLFQAQDLGISVILAAHSNKRPFGNGWPLCLRSYESKDLDLDHPGRLPALLRRPRVGPAKKPARFRERDGAFHFFQNKSKEVADLQRELEALQELLEQQERDSRPLEAARDRLQTLEVMARMVKTNPYDMRVALAEATYLQLILAKDFEPLKALIGKSGPRRSPSGPCRKTWSANGPRARTNPCARMCWPSARMSRPWPRKSKSCRAGWRSCRPAG